MASRKILAEEKFDKSLKMTKLNLLLSGIKVDDGEYNFIVENLIKYCLFYFTTIWVYTDVVGEIIWMIEGIQLGRNFEEIMLMTPCATICMLGTVKVAPLFYRRNTLIEVIEKIRSIHPEIDENDDERNIIEKDEKKKAADLERKISLDAMNHFDTIISLFYIMIVPVVAAFCLFPIILMGYDCYTTGETEIKFPFSAKYFFNTSRKSVWPFVYLHQVISTLIVISNIFSADTLFYAGCNFIQMHFKILRVKIEHLVGSWDMGMQKEVHRNLKKLIRRHQMLAEIVGQMEQLYSYSTLFNFVTSSFLICLSGFIVTTTHEMRMICCFSTFLFMSLSQIAIFCYGGDLIMQSSKDISLSVYNSRWYLADEGLKRSLFIVLMRAQRPCKLTAAGFADLNLSAFATVLRRSYSYFALLRTMYQ